MLPAPSPEQQKDVWVKRDELFGVPESEQVCEGPDVNGEYYKWPTRCFYLEEGVEVDIDV